MQTNFEWVIQLAGTLVFGGSFVFFLRRYRNNLKQRKAGEIAPSDPTFTIDLFFTLASLVIVLVIWSATLRDLFTGMLFLCALVSWLAWKLSQPKEVE
jgi:Ca2+/Na+ antiporter